MQMIRQPFDTIIKTTFIVENKYKSDSVCVRKKINMVFMGVAVDKLVQQQNKNNCVSPSLSEFY